MREARSFGIALLFILSSCKKQEAVQRVAEEEAGPIIIAASSAAPSASASASTAVAPEPIASAAESASAAPSASAPATNLGVLGHQGGYAPEHEHYMMGRQIKVPQIRVGTISVNGKLPMEVVRRIVRQHFPIIRACYEDGLRKNPTLRGRVSTKYVIGQDGAVVTSQDGGSDLADSNVVQCIAQAFKTFTYPKPEDGIVIVVFPLTFNPSDE